MKMIRKTERLQQELHLTQMGNKLVQARQHANTTNDAAIQLDVIREGLLATSCLDVQNNAKEYDNERHFHVKRARLSKNESATSRNV
ncbi:hypothetical protein BC937DRAFT_91591 [Endogone sp. FLAS-F59071]|nr:hypothetical protein BC937DRAFT_91591 [Endogone sp. FLAS-F59071]|eukprot:RUS16127.1 hypothetical protein BC937DRAFT_91591 [Endogone sp. FLAS-F59071]